MYSISEVLEKRIKEEIKKIEKMMQIASETPTTNRGYDYLFAKANAYRSVLGMAKQIDEEIIDDMNEEIMFQ